MRNSVIWHSFIRGDKCSKAHSRQIRGIGAAGPEGKKGKENNFSHDPDRLEAESSKHCTAQSVKKILLWSGHSCYRVLRIWRFEPCFFSEKEGDMIRG